MSYGRSPFYIYGCIGCGGIHFHGAGVECEDVPSAVHRDAIAQFIASIANRGGAELLELLERGKQLRPEISRELTIEVRGAGWRK